VVAANGIYRLSVIGTVLGQQHVHTLHFRSTLAGNAVAMDEATFQQGIIDDWQANARTQYRGMFYSIAFPCENYQVRKVCGGTPLPAGVDEAEAGGSTGGALGSSTAPGPPWLANVVTWRTALAGRSFRGRSFFGGLDEADFAGAVVQANRLTPTGVYCTALITAFVTPLETAVNQKLFVFSGKLAATVGIACQDAGSDVKSFQARTALATMKSRKAGHGI
jgi:hypothetical protein